MILEGEHNGQTYCVAVGRLCLENPASKDSPVRMFNEGQDGEMYSFRIAISIRGNKTLEGGGEIEQAYVNVYPRLTSTAKDRNRQIDDLMKMIRRGDMILVMGRSTPVEGRTVTRKGWITRTTRKILAEVIIPVNWITATLIAVYSKVIHEAPALTKVEFGQPVNKKPLKNQPTRSHPVVVKKEEWFE